MVEINSMKKDVPAVLETEYESQGLDAHIFLQIEGSSEFIA